MYFLTSIKLQIIGMIIFAGLTVPTITYASSVNIVESWVTAANNYKPISLSHNRISHDSEKGITTVSNFAITQAVTELLTEGGTISLNAIPPNAISLIGLAASIGAAPGAAVEMLNLKIDSKQ